MACKSRRNKLPQEPDTYVIYWSQQDDRWVAHSLRTDQIGLGEGPLYALAEMMKAVNAVAKLAAEDDTIQPWREAPDSVQKLLAKADPLPKEIYEVAYKMVHGDWPDNLKLEAKPSSRRKKFTVRERELTGV